MKTRTYRRVYIWELPVRIFHWVNAFAVTALVATGLIMANPPAIMSNAEASEIYWFGTVRFIHFTAAYIFFFTMILRLYWAFMGNKFASWKAVWPISKKAWRNFLNVVKVDLFLANEKDPNAKNVSIGHNSAAGFSYIVMFLLALVQVFTGFGLYSSMSGWWLPDMFGWVPAFFGGEFMVRTIHHSATWLFILFVLVHVYLVFYHDWLEGRGEVSAMFSGYKFVREERIVQEEADEVIEEPTPELAE